MESESGEPAATAQLDQNLAGVIDFAKVVAAFYLTLRSADNLTDDMAAEFTCAWIGNQQRVIIVQSPTEGES
jgi:hypothetical protein